MIDIKNSSGIVRVSVPVTENAVYKKELMKEEYVSLPFSLAEIVDFERGDYVETQFGRFELTKLTYPEFNNTTGGYDYTLRFDAAPEKWKNHILFYDRQRGKEKAWSLTRQPQYFMDIVASNLATLGLLSGNVNELYTVQSDVENSIKYLSFDSRNIFDALTDIAEAWDTEWWFDGRIIHLGRCEYGTDVVFEYPLVASMTRNNGDSSKYATRVYAFGSTRNIPTSYRPSAPGTVIEGIVEKRLMLPEGVDYVDAWPDLRPEDVVEAVVVFDEIYPKRIGTISTVATVERSDEVENEDGTTTVERWNAYRITDNNFTFHSDYIIPGRELHIVFQSGNLNGLDFAVAFNPDNLDENSRDSQVFEIVRNEEYGASLPNDILHPVAGDEYILYGFDIKLVSDQYIPQAEQELLKTAQKYVEKSKIDPSVYNCVINPIRAAGYIEEEFSDLDIIDLEVGQKVKLVNAAFFKDGRSSRIYGFEKKLDNRYEATYIVGETTQYSRIGDIEDKVDELIYQGKSYIGAGGKGVYLITKYDKTQPTDFNTYSALRSDAEFLHRTKPDVAHESIDFKKNITVGELSALNRATIKDYLSSEKFISGLTGEGMKIWKDALGKWNGEIDNLTVREIFSVFELLIQKNRSINGALTVSNGNGKIKSVTETDTHYLLEMEGDLTLMPDDFIRCQTWGTGEVEEYKFDFTDSSKWRTNLFDAPWLVSEYTDNLYRVNSISNSEESYFLLGYDLNGGESIDISLKISGLEEGDRLVVATGSTNNQIAQEITSVGTYTFNYLNDNNDGRIDTFVIIYQTTSVGTKNLLIEQVPEKKIETVTNKFYWVKVDGIENGKVKILKSEFDDGNQQPVAYPYDFTDSSKWTSNPYNNPELVSEYTDHSFRINNILGNDEPDYILLVHGAAGGGGDVNISLKISGLAEGDELRISNGTASSSDYRTITADGTYTFNYTDDSEGADSWTVFVIAYTTPTAGTKNLLIEQIPEQPGFNSAWALNNLSFTVTHTLNSIHLTNAGDEQDAFAYRTLKPGESIRLNLQVAGLASGQEIRTIGGTPDAQEPLIITGDGTYKVEYRNTNDTESLFLLGYKGAIGPCDITVSIVGDASKLPAVGDEVVQMGNEKDLMRQALIYISAIGEPKIDALAGINSKSFAGKTKARVGYLGDIVDPDFPADKQPQGYGGYFPNFYGKGTLVLASGETVEGYTNSTILSVVPGEVKSEISKSVPGIRNYVLGSRMNRTDNCHLFGGTVNLVEDEKFGTVVEYSRPQGGGEFQFLWELSSTTELNNVDVVFSVIAKRMSDTGDWNFGGWNTTFDLCRTTDSNQIDLGGGWIQYWATAKKEYIRGTGNSGAFGINTVSGTWRFYAVAVYKGNRPTDWTPAPEDVISESTSLIHQTAEEINLSVTQKVKAGKIYIKGTGLDRPESRMLIINDDGNNYFINNRGLALAVIDRWTLAVKEVSYYDVYGDTAAQDSLADKLNSLDDSGFVALASFDAIQIPDALRQALIRCGSSGYINIYRCPYAFLGLPGIGLGRGIEISVANTTAPPAEITTSIVNAMFAGSDNAAYEYTKGEVSVTAERIRLQLNDTGIDIANKRITLKAAETHITTADGRNIALFTTDASGNPIIQGSFLKLTDGAEIAGFVVDGRKLYNADGASAIEIGSTSRERYTRISAGLYDTNIISKVNSIYQKCASFVAPDGGVSLALGGGCISGLSLKLETVGTNGTINPDTGYVIATGSSIKLPSRMQKGTLLFIKNRFGGRMTVDANGHSIYIHIAVNSVSIEAGDLWMFVFDGTYWNANYMVR